MLGLLFIACEESSDGSGEKSRDSGHGNANLPGDTADSADTGLGDSGEPDSGGDTGPGDTGDSGEPAEEVLADSVSGFSNTQGENGWYYGYVEPDFADSFVEMPTFNEGGADPGWYAAAGGQYWTFIDADTMHPNGETTTGGRDPVEQWAVRRWVSTVDGDVHLTGHLAKLSVDGETNGVNGYVFVDGVMRWAWFIEGWDDVGVDIDKTITVAVGSTVDFTLDPVDSDDRSDRSYFTGTISR
jgi:hypothetical protein